MSAGSRTILCISLQFNPRLIDGGGDKIPFIHLLSVSEITGVVFRLESGDAKEGPDLEKVNLGGSVGMLDVG